MWSVNLADTDAAANWLPYPAPQNALIEAAHARGAKSLALVDGTYKIDFNKKRQVRKDDASRWRPIRREDPADDGQDAAMPAAAAAAAPAGKAAAGKKKRPAEDAAEADLAAAAAAASCAGSDHRAAKKPHSMMATAAAASSSSASAAVTPARAVARTPSLSGLAAVELQCIFHFLDSVSICLLGRVSRAAQTVLPRAWRHTLLRLDSVHPLAQTECPKWLTQRNQPARVLLRWRSPRLVPATADEDEPPASDRITALFAMPILPFIVDLDASAAGEDVSEEDWARLFSHSVLAANLRAFRGFEGEDGDAPTSLLSTMAEGMANLTSLSFKPDRCDDAEDWMQLCKLPKLTRLATQDEQLTLEALNGCAQLRHLDVYGSSLNFHAFHASEIATRLESLAWRWLQCGAAIPVAPPAAAAANDAASDSASDSAASSAVPSSKPPTASEYVRAFSALRALHTLELDQAFHIDAWVRHLARMPALRRLVIRPDIPCVETLDSEGQPKANDSAPSAAVLAKLMQACPALQEVTILLEPRPLPGDTTNQIEIDHARKVEQQLRERYAGPAHADVLVAPRFRIRNLFPDKAEEAAEAAEGDGEDEEGGGSDQDGDD